MLSLGLPHNLKYWLALRSLPGVGAITGKRLIDKFKTAEALFNADRQQLIKAGVKKATIGAIE